MMRIHFVAPVGRIFYACMPLSRHARTHIRPAQRADTRVCVWIPRRALPPARAHKHAVHGMRVWHGSASCCAWCGNQHPSPRAPCVCARQRPQQVPLPTHRPLGAPLVPPRSLHQSTLRRTHARATRHRRDAQRAWAVRRPRISPRGRRTSPTSLPRHRMLLCHLVVVPRRVVDTIFIHPRCLAALSGGFSPRRLAVEA